jgi:hypothetical protein
MSTNYKEEMGTNVSSRPRAGSWTAENLSPEATSVSVSRRTDIPAYFGEWFKNRLAAGFAHYIPMGPPRRCHCSLRPEAVTHFVFWTKNPGPFLPVLADVLEVGFPVLCNVTITGLGGTPVEPNVPSAKAVVASVRQLAQMVTPSAIMWRYDPIFMSDVYGQDFHVETFTRLAGELAGHVDRIAVSFVDLSKAGSDLRRYQGENGDQLERVPLAEQADLVGRLHDAAEAVGLELTLCGGKELRQTTAYPSSGCNSFEWARRVYPELRSAPRMKKRATRKACCCVAEKDIGVYGTCRHGCRYCYGNESYEKAMENFQQHDPLGPCLIPADSLPLVKAKAKSCGGCQQGGASGLVTLE